MVGWKRVQFGVKVHVWGVDPDSRARRLHDFHICMDLCNRDSQGGASVDDGVFTKENDLAGCRSFHDK